MPTIYGTLPRSPGPESPCLWCGRPTDVTFTPQFRPELGPLPMHMFCGVAMIRAYERLRDGMVLTAREQARLHQVVTRQLPSGSTAIP
jgi:hypothetical protein